MNKEFLKYLKNQEKDARKLLEYLESDVKPVVSMSFYNTEYERLSGEHKLICNIMDHYKSTHK